MLDHHRRQIAFRVIHDTDRAFLRQVYAATREWEFTLTVWPEDEKRDFLQRQFEAQDLHYARAFPGAVRRIITLDGTDIGRLYIDRRDEVLHIIELSLLPAWQRRGIGTDILRSLLNEAHGGKVPVRLKVERTSPALRLYQRHGFRQTGSEGHHLSLEWRPDTRPREL
ncbi:GNAT family N-acetyltransferase [Salipiger mucosus]|uniref:Acetyltransferase, GNAT family n=1 Tax=Salipiger mucosus DSM 16094 TaxID=1123237 RepID=S9RW80_9RHOB|nr:GNAT family N-acetyltransferase [Salipiger mucosus]EPX82285.1 Acetyltransferase, GNAT family [Salipiger mucosus DSM 16094]